ncbi:MAG TPA: heavy-metal-associated domain-containing protein [Pyrinomonadaceae bacterium]|nr:heavy-metal-associated domain-containing protein [Pyrinomonadaceae bacterium]
MKKERVAPILGMILVLALGSLSVLAATKTATIRVEGMHCNMCSASVAKALKATDGVEKVEVSSEKGVAVIQYDDRKVTEAKLREVINGTGFKAIEEKPAATAKMSVH